MSNSISFVGHLGSDAELKHVGENTVLEFRVANNVGFGDKKVTNWFRCSMWGRQAQTLEQYMVKGKTVFVAGELTLRQYTTKDGVEKLSPDIRVRDLDLVGGQQDSGQDSGSRRAKGYKDQAGSAQVPEEPSSSGGAAGEQQSKAGDEDMPF